LVLGAWCFFASLVLLEKTRRALLSAITIRPELRKVIDNAAVPVTD